MKVLVVEVVNEGTIVDLYKAVQQVQETEKSMWGTDINVAAAAHLTPQMTDCFISAGISK